MSRARKRFYHVEPNLEGEFDVIESVQGSPNTSVLLSYSTEALAGQAALTLASLADTDWRIRTLEIPVTFASAREGI